MSEKSVGLKLLYWMVLPFAYIFNFFFSPGAIIEEFDNYTLEKQLKGFAKVRFVTIRVFRAILIWALIIYSLGCLIFPWNIEGRVIEASHHRSVFKSYWDITIEDTNGKRWHLGASDMTRWFCYRRGFYGGSKYDVIDNSRIIESYSKPSMGPDWYPQYSLISIGESIAGEKGRGRLIISYKSIFPIPIVATVTDFRER